MTTNINTAPTAPVSLKEALPGPVSMKALRTGARIVINIHPSSRFGKGEKLPQVWND